MIPDHLIDKAAAAIYAVSVVSGQFAYDAWDDLPGDSQVKTSTRMFAHAALHAVAPGIWDEGYEFALNRVVWENDPEPTNPYRASESA